MPLSDDLGLGIAPLGDTYKDQWKALSAWFLGPRAENSEVFMDTFKEIFREHVRLRKSYFPSDPVYITEEMKSSDAYQSEIADMKEELMTMHKQMEGNVPFFSPRYQAHMLWDISMSALLGYMSAMLFNQNNVDTSASPVTTLYERKVGQQLCDMMGYNIYPEKEGPLAWGHVTCGGSVANIEALWASRNMKFLPLAVKAALMNEDPVVGPLAFFTKEQVELGLQTPLLVYSKELETRKLTPLKGCNNWQLLNVDIDEICDLVENVIKKMTSASPGSLDEAEDRFHDMVEKESIRSLGLFSFLKKHQLEHTPIYTAPANYHYSWPKAGTLLGLGSDALIPIELDVNFRQDVAHLREVLEESLKKEIPVISVTAVMGSTEQSAVDPIAEIHDLRQEFEAKGLNFALLADGAWGGYFKTMLIDVPTKDVVPVQRRLMRTPTRRKLDSYVPYCELSPYVQKQYSNIQLADTITIDPHKSGFCPYPGGALCYRNGKMRYSLAFYHPEVYHGKNDPSMGPYGIEGSKPGAAPSGILMSHNVIGLSNRGYGRILGQCTATAKLFYTMWLSVARHDDPFLCVPIQSVPEGYNIDSAKKLIQEKIAFKSMAEIQRDREARSFLKLCGPDTMINTFVVNFKDNDDVQQANELQLALSDALNITVGTNARRVPLMVMQSGMDARKHGKGLKVFKEKAGLRADDTDLNVMVNTCMNPWQWNETISNIGDMFRLIVLNCIGRVKDSVVNHRFILSASFDDTTEDDSIFIEYMTGTDIPEHQYQATVKVETTSLTDKEKLRDYIQDCTEKGDYVLFETVTSTFDESDENKPNLYNILHGKKGESKLQLKLPNQADEDTITVKVLDIPRYQRLDLSSTITYPKRQQYFIYGDSTRTIMSHVMSKLPDFQHTVTLAKRPHSLTEMMLEEGVVADIRGVDGSPLMVNGEMKPPFQRSSYEISFTGELYTSIHTSVKINNTVYFKAISQA